MLKYPQLKTFRISLRTGLLVCTLLAVPGVSVSQGLFDKGTKQLSVIVGSTQSFNEDYLVLGVGFGYYMFNGLELAVNWQSWLGGDPSVNQLTPSVTYVFRNTSNVDPYLGALYRWTFISDLDDLTAWGGRAGVYIATGRKSALGLGAVYIQYNDCNTTIYTDCSDTYPELSYTFTF
jgi:hypothetical protein